MKRTETRIATTALALVVALAGCGLGKDDDRPVPEPPTTAAATLRVTLDLLFREHVYLLGLVTENVITKQIKGFEGAAEALEQNALALADEFEKTYAERGEKGFLTAWRRYTDLMAQYADRKVRKLKLTKVDQAFARAAGNVASFSGALTPLINPRLMGTRMRDLIVSIRAAIDAQVAKDYKKADASLRTASERAADIATVFARAFADDVPGLFPGDPSSPAAGLRAALSASLTEHVYFVGMTAENLLTDQAGPRDGAKAALDAATASLAKQVGASYGAEAEKAFLPLWKRQGDLLINYASSAKDKAKKDKVGRDLGQYATDASGFLVGLNAGLDASSIERIVDEHSRAMARAIDAQVAGDFKQADLTLRLAARQLEALGAALAAATVRRFPVRFRSTPAGFST